MTTTIRKSRVAFQGERGAFSEEAALLLLGHEIQLVPCQTFADLFQSLEHELADYLLAPVENSIAGPVRSCLDLLESSSLAVLDEVELRIEQHLIGCPGTTFQTIETVRSHPVALDQCRRFFEMNPQLAPVTAIDTAGSVAEVVRRGDQKHAAIAGQRAADLYGGTIIRRGVQDHSENYTRFVLLSAPTQANPTYPASVKEHRS